MADHDLDCAAQSHGRRPRVALVNVWSDHNRGDAAIVHATCEAILGLYPTATIDLHNVVFNARDTLEHGREHFESFASTPYTLYPAIFPSMVVRRGQAKARRVTRVLHFVRALVTLALAAVRPTWGMALLRKDERSAYKALLEADCVLSKGGSYLLGNSWQSVFQITMVMFPLVLARICGGRTALLGVSVGPATNRLAAWTMRFWFRWIDRFVLREQHAVEMCRDLGIPEAKVTLLPDFAFLIAITEEHRPAEPDQLIGLPEPRVAVTVRRWAFADLPREERSLCERRYLEGVAEALVHFQREHGGTIVLVPQVVGPGRRGSDLDALDIVEKHVCGRARVVRVDRNVTHSVLRAVYANVDMLVGTRLHSVILALGTPTVIVGYQGNKSLGTARLLGLEDAFIHINDVDYDGLVARLRTVWAARSEFRQIAAKRRTEFSEWFARDLEPVLRELVTERPTRVR